MRVLRHASYCFLMLGFSVLVGCAPVLIASVGAVAGYAASKDSVTIDLDRPIERVWTACLDEVQEVGTMKKQDHADYRIDARVQKTDVAVTLEQLTPATVRLVIRARKRMLPRVEVAQKLGVSIARRVN